MWFTNYSGDVVSYTFITVEEMRRETFALKPDGVETSALYLDYHN
jgi:hypothetical protein